MRAKAHRGRSLTNFTMFLFWHWTMSIYKQNTHPSLFHEIFSCANPRGKLFVESPLYPFVMLSLAISSLGKQDGRRWRKIIWTFSLAMDPLPPRGVRGAGQGDSLGQYSGVGGGSCNGEGGKRTHKGELERVALQDPPALRWIVLNVAMKGCVSVLEIRGMRELLTVPAQARSSHTQVRANDRRSSGIERCYGLVRDPPPPICPLLPTSFLLHHRGHGTSHKTDTRNIELLIQCLHVCVRHHTNESVIDTMPQ